MSVMALGNPSWRFFKCGLIRAGTQYCQAASTRARRAGPLPILVMPPCWRSVPVVCSLGTSPEVTHQLAGMVEAVEIAQFGHQRGRVEQRQPAQTHQRPHHRFPAPARHRPLNFLVVAFQPLGGFGDDVEHLLENNLLDREGHFDLGQITQMRRRPRRSGPRNAGCGATDTSSIAAAPDAALCPPGNAPGSNPASPHPPVRARKFPSTPRPGTTAPVDRHPAGRS